jgi:hypothetical protein
MFRTGLPRARPALYPFDVPIPLSPVSARPPVRARLKPYQLPAVAGLSALILSAVRTPVVRFLVLGQVFGPPLVRGFVRLPLILVEQLELPLEIDLRTHGDVTLYRSVRSKGCSVGVPQPPLCDGRRAADVEAFPLRRPCGQSSNRHASVSEPALPGATVSAYRNSAEILRPPGSTAGRGIPQSGGVGGLVGAIPVSPTRSKVTG